MMISIDALTTRIQALATLAGQLEEALDAIVCDLRLPAEPVPRPAFVPIGPADDAAVEEVASGLPPALAALLRLLAAAPDGLDTLGLRGRLAAYNGREISTHALAQLVYRLRSALSDLPYGIESARDSETLTLTLRREIHDA